MVVLDLQLKHDVLGACLICPLFGHDLNNNLELPYKYNLFLRLDKYLILSNLVLFLLWEI